MFHALCRNNKVTQTFETGCNVFLSFDLLIDYNNRAECIMQSSYKNPICIILAAIVITTCASHAQDVVINEFSAGGNSTLPDEDLEYTDWIELQNISSNAVNLNGWHLTDNAGILDKWTFPSTNLASGTFLVIFASNKNRAQSGKELHTNFKLDADGEYLGLVRPDGEAIEHAFGPQYPSQKTDISFGACTNVYGGFGYFTNSTPGSSNGLGFMEFVADTKFDPDRGFYTNSFQASITSITEEATIYYTLDGSEPTTNNAIYTNGFPLTITNTTILRARAFKFGYQPTDIDTHTYIFLGKVLEQPADPAGFPNNWNGTVADYEMDPEVVNNPAYSNIIIDALLSLPTISIVTHVDNLFSAATGIYANPGAEGEAWERPVSIEWIDPANDKDFQLNAGLRIYGGAFRSMDLSRKKTFRILFKQMYGVGKLDFPLFTAKTAINSFDTLILRAGANDGYNNWGGANTQYIIDEYMRHTQLAMGKPVGHGRFVHLYLNGLYWGQYNMAERTQQSFAARYFGGNQEDWDTINAGEPTGDSQMDLWNELFAQVRGGLSDNVSYQKLQGNNPDRRLTMMLTACRTTGRFHISVVRIFQMVVHPRIGTKTA